MIFRKQKPVPAELLTEKLLRKSPVWEFCNDDETGETMVRPVAQTPVMSGESRLFGCELRFADGSTGFGLIGNLSLADAERNRHFITLSIFVGGEIYHLARYHDFDVAERGPASLAMKVSKTVEEVFPISYDISGVAAGSAECVRGLIRKEPKTKLTRDEFIKMAVP